MRTSGFRIPGTLPSSTDDVNDWRLGRTRLRKCDSWASFITYMIIVTIMSHTTLILYISKSTHCIADTSGSFFWDSHSVVTTSISCTVTDIMFNIYDYILPVISFVMRRLKYNSPRSTSWLWHSPQVYRTEDITTASSDRNWLKLCPYELVAYRTGKDSKCHNSRDAVDEVHLSLVADAGQICIHTLTVRTSFRLTSLRRWRVEAAVGAVIVIPAVRTYAT